MNPTRRGFLGLLAAAPIAAPAIAGNVGQAPASLRATLGGRLCRETAAKLRWMTDMASSGGDLIVERASDGGFTVAFTQSSALPVHREPQQDSTMEELIELPRVTRSGIHDAALMLRAASFDEAANTVEVIWTTGATVRRYDWRSDGYIDEQLVVDEKAIRLDRLNSGAPFLNTHDAWSLESVIGAVVRGSARVVNGQGLATIQLSRVQSLADIIQNIRDGIIQNISVGYRIHGIEKTEGEPGTVPLWRVVDWEPLEISAVPIGADAGCHPRSADNVVRFPAVLTTRDCPEAVAAATRMRMRHAESEALRTR